MVINETSRAILRRMYYFGFIGNMKHITFEDLIVNFPNNVRGTARPRLEELIEEENLILRHMTEHGEEYSIDSQSLDEIDEILS